MDDIIVDDIFCTILSSLSHGPLNPGRIRISAFTFGVEPGLIRIKIRVTTLLAISLVPRPIRHFMSSEAERVWYSRFQNGWPEWQIANGVTS